jgi:hypothetical protein
MKKRKSKLIKNGRSPSSEKVYLKNDKPKKHNCDIKIEMFCNAEGEVPENGVPTLKFSGYSGDAVNLSDYGFDAPVVYNIASMKTSQKIPILYDHHEVIGHTTSVRKSEGGSSVTGAGLASVPNEANRQVVAGLKNGFPWQASMGLRLRNWDDVSYIAKGETVVNNRTFKAPIYVVENARLVEMTVTGFGRDSNTEFTNSLDKDTLMLIKNSGTTATSQTTPPENEGETKETTKVENSTPEPNKEPAPAPVPPINNQTPEQGSEVAQVMRVLKLSKKYPDHLDIIEQGIANGWDDERIDDRVQLTIINKNTPKPPSSKTLVENHSLLQARFCLSFGAQPEVLEKKFGKETTGRAFEMAEVGIVEMLLMVANSAGGNYTGHSDIDNLCKFVKNTGYSTFDLPDFFTKVGDAMKDARWELNPPFATQVCKIGSNRNFNIQERKRITGGDMWNEVAEDGKLELWSSGGQKTYQTNLTTFGALFTMTRKEVINDDMGALADLMDQMVEGAMVIPDYQLGRLMLSKEAAPGTFWVNADNSFASRALTRTNLSLAFNKIRQYTEKKNRVDWNVMLNERWSLIVSPNLEETAWDLLKQDRVVSNSTPNTLQGDKNYWSGRMDLKVFGQMANTSAYDVGPFVGDTTWILWPSSVKFAPYEMTVLRGQTRPTVEAVPLPATLLGFGNRGWWDTKINERERTAIQRNTAQSLG